MCSSAPCLLQRLRFLPRKGCNCKGEGYDGRLVQASQSSTRKLGCVFAIAWKVLAVRVFFLLFAEEAASLFGHLRGRCCIMRRRISIGSALLVCSCFLNMEARRLRLNPSSPPPLPPHHHHQSFQHKGALVFACALSVLRVLAVHVFFLLRRTDP